MKLTNSPFNTLTSKNTLNIAIKETLVSDGHCYGLMGTIAHNSEHFKSNDKHDQRPLSNRFNKIVIQSNKLNHDGKWTRKTLPWHWLMESKQLCIKALFLCNS